MATKTETTITKIINGNHYTALRVVEGTRKIRQHLVFRGHTEPDSETYSPGQEEKMASNADHILWQLVVLGWLGQSPLEPKEDHGSGS